MEETNVHEGRRMTPFQKFKRSKPSEKLESIRFKYFKLPPELRELVEAEAAKEEQEGMEWIANVGLILQEKGLNKDQISKIFESRAPSITDGSQRNLIDFLNSFLGPQESTGDSSNHFRPTHKGNKNYVFSGTELQPLKNRAVVGDLKNSDLTDTEMGSLLEHQARTGNLMGYDMGEAQKQADKEKYKNPPQFTPEELDSIRSTFDPLQEHRLTTYPHQPSASQASLTQTPPTQCPLTPLRTHIPLIQHTLLSTSEYLCLLFLLTQNLHEQLSTQTCGIVTAVSIGFLLCNYVCGFFQHQITWLWPLVGGLSRLCVRVGPLVALVCWGVVSRELLVLICAVLVKFGVVRAVLCVLGKENSTVASTCAMLNAVYIVHGTDFSSANGKDGSGLPDWKLWLLIAILVADLEADVLLWDSPSELWSGLLSTAEQRLAKLLIVPHQMKLWRDRNSLKYATMYPTSLVQ